ncbi:uncharacterized protein LOC129601148 [Paramacrobiotus metropolitanus]|uniref:uncharacterized protein LOC129601148 n=1 Tax=Paramacrobiotus metropolitanus TaxID=2943436 RepID=UPI0024463905|nr:uncharacterized protein LOC129601148 [Paramacrobiotus metropolitanus]
MSSSTLLILITFTAVSDAQFPSYFYSSQNNLSPPNCVCASQQQGLYNTYPSQIPNNNYVYPGGQLPVNQYPNQPSINPYPNNPNYPANPFPSNNVPGNLIPPLSSNNPNVDRGQGNNFGQRHFGGPFGYNGASTTMTNYRICGTDNNMYTDVCQFVNAQAANSELGGRPCDLAAAIQEVNSGSALSRQDNTGPVCLNTRVSSSSANFALGVMSTSPSIGIRCQGSCPCQLRCPSTQAGSMQSPSTFHHWSFQHGHHGHGRPFGR